MHNDVNEVTGITGVGGQSVWAESADQNIAFDGIFLNGMMPVFVYNAANVVQL